MGISYDYLLKTNYDVISLYIILISGLIYNFNENNLSLML